MSAETIAQKWHDQFLRTDPIDHRRAEDACRAVYRTAGLPEPQRFLWCASPFEAVSATLVLLGKTDGYNHAVLEDVERSKSGKAIIAKARETVAERLGIAEDEVEGYFGKPFYRAEGSNPVTKKLNEGIADVWMARAEAGDDFLAPHRAGPFHALHQLEESLHYEGYKQSGGRQQGSLLNEALAAAGGKALAILGARSAQHRLYGNLAYVELACDEALAEAGKFLPTDLQRAIWSAYDSCGMWWPCEGGIIFSERPIAVHGTGSGLCMEWGDGFSVGEGTPKSPAQTAATVAADAAAPPATSRQSPILDRALPRDHGSRITELRNTGNALPLFARYLAGEHQQVWNELVALGDNARSEERAADALAVAYETMERVAHNVRLLAQRLNAIGYRFIEPGSRGGLFGLGKPKSHPPFSPPSSTVAASISELETAAGGPIPLSLRAFFEVVGEVDFTGEHAILAPRDSAEVPDPLVVHGVEDAIACIESLAEDQDGDLAIWLAPDALHKANVSGGDPYTIRVPAPVADALFDGEPHGVTFVKYLRLCMRWGGFPGWQSAATPPQEIEQLSRDLLPF